MPFTPLGMHKEVEGSGGGKATVKQEESDMPQSVLEFSGNDNYSVHNQCTFSTLIHFNLDFDSNVLAEKTVQVTNKEQYIVWEGYGLRLYIPHNSLPEDVKQCHLQMQVALSGKFDLPEDCILVSAVYSFSHDLGDKELRHSVTLEMQHCANTSALKDLCVVRSIDVPYKFEIIPGGDFTQSNGYGVINLRRFSRYSIWKRICSIFSSSDDFDYCAKIYYTNISRHQFDFEFVIIRDLDALAKVCDVNIFLLAYYEYPSTYDCLSVLGC